MAISYATGGRQGGQISGALLARQTRILIRNETSPMPGNGVHCVLDPFTPSIVCPCVCLRAHVRVLAHQPTLASIPTLYMYTGAWWTLEAPQWTGIVTQPSSYNVILHGACDRGSQSNLIGGRVSVSFETHDESLSIIALSRRPVRRHRGIIFRRKFLSTVSDLLLEVMQSRPKIFDLRPSRRLT